jgi:hypothetical protein
MEPQPVTPKDPESEPPPSAALRFLAHRNREHLYVVSNICVLKPFAVKCSATELYPLLKPFVTQKYSREMKTWTYKIITQAFKRPWTSKTQRQGLLSTVRDNDPHERCHKGTKSVCVLCQGQPEDRGALCCLAWLYFSRKHLWSRFWRWGDSEGMWKGIPNAKVIESQGQPVLDVFLGMAGGGTWSVSM